MYLRHLIEVVCFQHLKTARKCKIVKAHQFKINKINLYYQRTIYRSYQLQKLIIHKIKIYSYLIKILKLSHSLVINHFSKGVNQILIMVKQLNKLYIDDQLQEMIFYLKWFNVEKLLDNKTLMVLMTNYLLIHSQTTLKRHSIHFKKKLIDQVLR